MGKKVQMNIKASVCKGSDALQGRYIDARPLLQKQAIKELLDPRLMNCYSEQEVYCMALCAYLCIRRDPNSRPRMSQVLRMLEGDVVMSPI
ncbi:hypothetical protein YC2023_015130 [Brassica napus]